jgi:hypothetical protein
MDQQLRLLNTIFVSLSLSPRPLWPATEIAGARQVALHQNGDYRDCVISGHQDADPVPAAHPAHPLRRRTRPQRWRAAVAELLALQAEYVAWLEALPEPLRESAIGEALQAIVDLDLDEVVAIVPPRGFGRD